MNRVWLTEPSGFGFIPSDDGGVQKSEGCSETVL